MAYINDEVFDQGLDYADVNGTRVDLCSQEPVTYTEATSTYTLCNKTGVNTGAPEDGGSAGGRVVIVPEITDGDVTNPGTATHWALTNGSDTLIATGALLSPRPFTTAGNKFRLEAIEIAIRDAAALISGVNAVTFDGANDFLDTQAMTGFTDSKVGIINFWERVNASVDGTSVRIITSAGDGSRFGLSRTNENRLLLDIKAQGGAQTVECYTDADDYIATGVWRHSLISWDTAANRCQIYRDDANVVFSGGSPSDATLDYSTTSENYDFFNLNGGGAQVWVGDFAEFYINLAASLDLSVEANRRKFIDASGKPVDLGSDGSTPTGSQPNVFLSGATASWPTNKGTGGGFTVHTGGSLDTASSSPSD